MTMLDVTEKNNRRARLRVVVLISGSGRTLQNLIDLSHAGQLPIEIVLVISSRSDVAGVERARTAEIPVEIIRRSGLSVEAFSERVTAAVDTARADLVCMAGWLCPWIIPDRYAGRVMNIHPALLPKYGGKGFYGHRVHQAVLASGDRETGCTVHFANNEYDAGPIILQRKVAVLPDDLPEMLAARVFEQECIAYPEAIRLFAEGRLKLEGEKVIIEGERAGV